jgi:phospholipase/carboxylesterase
VSSSDLDRYEAALAPAVESTLGLLWTLERVQRHLDPMRLGALAEVTHEQRERLRACTLADAVPPERLRGFHDCWLDGIRLADESATAFLEAGASPNPILGVLSSMKKFARAAERLYAIHEFPPLSRYFVEKAFHERLRELDPPRREGSSVGLHHTGGTDGASARGQLCLYVPESDDGSTDLPLVVALHGGSGSGRDFLWAWLREARGRRFLLLAPTASGPTWPLVGSDEDGRVLRAMVRWVAERWRVKQSSILLTGLSDGATYSLLTGLGEDSPFTAFAPVSGVLHPGNFTNGNIERARGRRIYLVHGARDWMFPVETARWAHERLAAAGAEVLYREIEDLSHTYPREENDRILAWFDPTLALPAGPPLDSL